MDLKKVFSIKRTLFILLFIIMVFVGNKINFSPLLGAENQYFTLFQFFGPIPGAFLGPIYGVVAVAAAQLGEFMIAGKAWSIINIIRLTPMLFAAYYFGSRKNWSVLIPIIATMIFVSHPVGREVWYFSFYWMIPIVVKGLVKVLPKKFKDSTFFKSLGATFTAHAVGSAAFIWAVPTTADLWITLIPIVAVERLLFTAGITASYKGMNLVLNILVDKLNWKIPADILNLEKRKLHVRA